MDDNLNFETFLIISSDKIEILVYNDANTRIYENKLSYENISNELIIQKLDHFLDNNVLKIEKKIKNFVKKISIILDIDIFFTVDISVKKNNFNDEIKLINLNHLLYEAKDYCKKTISERKIIHMTIENYKIDNINYPFLPKAISCSNFSLDIKFICISFDVLRKIEQTLKKYQITLEQLQSANYISQFLGEKEKDIVLIGKKMLMGHNPNEVFLVDKTPKNQGFFERFFNFFN